MPGSLPGIIIKLSADTKDAIDGLNRVKGALGDSATSADKWNAVGPKIATALGVATAAAGAFAIKLGIDAVKAAMDEEVAVGKLATAMTNLGMASSNARVQAFIDDMQFATGVADDELRPAMQRLLTATKDVGESQTLLQLALDLSAAGYGTVGTAADALSKAAGGNLGALQRLTRGGLDPATVKSKDFHGAVKDLSNLVDGQAATAADTLRGKFKRLGVAMDELKESFGKGFLDSLFGGDPSQFNADANGIITDVRNMQGSMETFGKAMGGLAKIVASAWDVIRGSVVIAVYAVVQQFNAMYNAYIEIADKLGIISDQEADRERKSQKAIAEAQKKQYYRDLLNNQGLFGGRVVDPAAGGDGKGGGKGGEDPPPPPPPPVPGPEVKRVRLVWSEIAGAINQEVDGLTLSLTGKAKTIAGAMIDEFDNRKEAFRKVVAEQVDTIKQARDALASYAQSVTDTILGKLNFQTTTTNAEGKTVPMTPEQIMAALFGDMDNQGKAVDAMAGIVTKLPEAFAQKLLALPPDLQIAMANYLSNPENAALLAQLKANYQGLADKTKTLLSDPMATAFATVGGKLAVSMIDKAKESIAEQAADFKQWVKDKLHTSITVKVNYDTSGAPAGIDGARAMGGPITSGTWLVGERGPELVSVGGRGYVTPNDALGGSTYQINVTAGVGDPAAIGRTVVESIRAYERRNGAVFAAA